MRLKMVGFLARKELLETLRDRRTLLIMIFFPILLYPLIGLLSSQAQVVHRRKLRKTRYMVGVYGGLLPRSLVRQIEKNDNVTLLRDKKGWKKRLEGRGRLALVLDLKTPPPKRRSSRQKQPSPKGSRSKEKPRKPILRPAPATKPAGKLVGKGYKRLRMTFVYASTSDRGRAVVSRVKKALQHYQKLEIRRRLKKHGMALNLVRPLDLHKLDVVTKTNRIRFLLAKLLPLILILMTVMGAFYPAVDLTAGEKERGTLETLLTAPVKSIEIVSGKYIAVTFIAVLTGSLNLLSIWFTMSQGIRLAGRKMSFSFGLTGVDILVVFGFLVLVALLASALMMAIASLARSFKEGQNYVTPAYLACLMPTILATLPGNQPSFASSLIPFTNITFAIQETIKGTLQPWYGVMTLLSMGAAIAGGLWMASRLFEHEQVLFRDENLSATRLLLGNPNIVRRIPNPSEALLLLATLFLVMFYVGIPLQAKNIAIGLGVTLWGIIFLPPVLAAHLRKLNFRDTFRLKPVPWQLIPAVLLITVGALPLVSAMVDLLSPLLFPNWKEFLEVMQKSITAKNFGVSNVGMVILISLSPGICEEILFRGFILSGLRKSLKAWPAILLTALLFAAFHFSAHRLLPTFTLGVIMGWLCVRSGSIFPAMLFHLFNNGLALALNAPAVRGYAKHASSGTIGWVVLLLAIVCVVIGVRQFLQMTQTVDTGEDGLFA
jgi:sodium transport system permease protein